MIPVILNILKIIGIVLLVLLAVVLILLLLVLFVPIRYKGRIWQKPVPDQEQADTNGLKAILRAFWLLHIVNVSYSYPDAAYVRVRVFCFTVYSSNVKNEKEEKQGKKDKRKQDRQEDKKIADEDTETSKKASETEIQRTEDHFEEVKAKEAEQDDKRDAQQEDEQRDDRQKYSFVSFIQKLLEKLRNIKYTILQICDKIKHIIANIGYYIEVIKSDTFGRAWGICSVEVISLLKKILPGKIKGRLLIGTGDPASTGQVLAAYGMLYPLIGGRIDLEPDFENKIIDGELLLKGKITVIRALKTAFVLYRNKDLRKVIKLFKREAA